MRAVVFALISSLPIVASCGGGEPPASEAPLPIQLPESELVVVERGTVATGPLVAGQLEASRSATVNARLGGTVREIGPELGDQVKTGQLLARIDPGPLGAAAASSRAQVEAAQRTLEVSRRELERTRKLVEQGAVPRRELEDAQTRVATQQAALDQARAQRAAAGEQLSDATVRSPIDGAVARRAVNAGDVVAPGALLYQIIDPSSMRLAATVPSDHLRSLAVDAPVEFTVQGFLGETFSGRIARVAPAADPQTRQIPILVELPNPSRRLLAGLFAQGRVATRSQSGLVIPSSALDATTQPPAVLRVANGKIERAPVTIGLVDPLRDTVLITAGLAPGDRIVRRATAAPPPGTAVATRR